MEPFDWTWVTTRAEETMAIWQDCGRGFGYAGIRYTAEEQVGREKPYDEALEAVERELRRASLARREGAETRERLTALFARFSASALGLDDHTIRILTEDFLPVGSGLARWARQFDPSLSMADIIQACRNAWTACGLQPLYGMPVGLTPSIFGYSMLYPYSDNFLDQESVSAEEKLRFSERFRALLRGEELAACSYTEEALRELVGLIEGEYPRPLFPEVFECLMAIHQAQEDSIRQVRREDDCSETEVLELSCRKGGSSVLADGCLAYGTLTEAEGRFAFEWGVLLQLGDDLQDVQEDLRRGSKTLFSRAAEVGGSLDKLAVQLLRFSEYVGARMDALPHGTTQLKELLKMSWRSLIVRAVADSHEYFTSEFLREAECCSPFRFAFLRARQQRLTSMHGLYALLFAAFLEEDGRGSECPYLAAKMAPSRSGVPSTR